ncbi:hypothetical protein CC80DRAFT_597209 [Byssothecium circinans]|uniref:Uncharacterized protein n=1 Tax=Byssothecium circinans TaxID=147558 RepID=A0A6A5TG02_9PLEO|nr:hypothetical protein CC80DRAFT_597209 [Byssothecium circinans]
MRRPVAARLSPTPPRSTVRSETKSPPLSVLCESLAWDMLGQAGTGWDMGPHPGVIRDLLALPGQSPEPLSISGWRVDVEYYFSALQRAAAAWRCVMRALHRHREASPGGICAALQPRRSSVTAQDATVSHHVNFQGREPAIEALNRFIC